MGIIIGFLLTLFVALIFVLFAGLIAIVFAGFSWFEDWEAERELKRLGKMEENELKKR